MSTEPVETTAARAAVNSRPDMQPYSGYYANHIPKYDPELTRRGQERRWASICAASGTRSACQSN
jgi:hypothetical protein